MEEQKFITKSFKTLRNKKIKHYLGFTDKSPSTIDRVIRTIGKLLKKPIFRKGNTDWLSELPSIIEKYKNTIHKNIKTTPIQASKKSNEKSLFKSQRQ